MAAGGWTTKKYTSKQYWAFVRKTADGAASLPESQQYDWIHDQVAGSDWAFYGNAMLAALQFGNVDPGELLTVDDAETEIHDDGVPFWNVMQRAVLLAMTLEIQVEAGK